RQSKPAMESLADELGNLELELSFSVEASADLGLLIPSIRIESFHRELYAAMELPERAATVSRMLSRLDAIIRSEIAAVEIREQQVKEGAKERVKERKDERKWLRRSIASVLSFAGVLLGSLQTFFGINVKLVNESGFDWGRYLYVYVVAGILALSPLIS